MRKTKSGPRFNLLIDTCVWLDLAKDYSQQPILTALEELIRQGDITLILPRTVVAEFSRNKTRIVEEGGRSLSSTLKRVKLSKNSAIPGKRARCCVNLTRWITGCLRSGRPLWRQ